MFGSRKLRMRDAPRCCRRSRPPPPATTRRRRSGRVASAARWAWRPRRRTRRCSIHADGSEARRAVLDVIAERDPRRSTSAPSSSPATASATRSPRRCAAKAGQGVRVRLLIDGIGAWLAGRLDVKALRRCRRRRGQLRAAVPLDPARPRQPAQPPQDDRRRRRSRLWCGGRNFAAEYFEGDPERGESPSGTTSASTCTASSRARAAEQFEEDWNYATRRSSRRAPRARAVPDRAARRVARAAGAERPRAGRRHRAGAARSRAASWRSGASSRSRRTSFPTRPC